MIDNMKVTLITIYAAFIIIFYPSCSKKKEIKVLGYAYKGEKITVVHGIDTVFNFQVEDREDSNSVCSFYKTTDLNINRNKLIVRVVVYSDSINMLDTVINFSKQQKEPFISLLYPNNPKGNNRKLFVGDYADSVFLKY